jgi:hypothetical protein
MRFNFYKDGGGERWFSSGNLRFESKMLAWRLQRNEFLATCSTKYNFFRRSLSWNSKILG